MKTKISLFLNPDIAIAVKIQAVRHGVKTSKLIEAIFTCHMCGKPIEGKAISLKGYGEFNVFIHEEECQYKLTPN